MQSLLKDNRKQLAIGILISALLIGIGIVTGLKKTAPSSEASKKSAENLQVETAVDGGAALADAVRRERDAERKEKARAAIAEHEEAIGANFQSKDTPDRMMAVGNLYQYQLGEYYSAIQSYQSLVDHFPDHTKAAQAYVEIARCYEEVGDEVQARYVYQEMVEELDPSLEHVKYAKLKLGEE